MDMVIETELGGTENYSFDEAGAGDTSAAARKVRLSQLFAEGKDTLKIRIREKRYSLRNPRSRRNRDSLSCLGFLAAQEAESLL